MVVRGEEEGKLRDRNDKRNGDTKRGTGGGREIGAIEEEGMRTVVRLEEQGRRDSDEVEMFERVREEEGGGDEMRGNLYRIAFWNVAGVLNKDKEFWRGLMDWDIMILIET